MTQDVFGGGLLTRRAGQNCGKPIDVVVLTDAGKNAISVPHRLYNILEGKNASTQTPILIAEQNRNELFGVYHNYDKVVELPPSEKGKRDTLFIISVRDHIRNGRTFVERNSGMCNEKRTNEQHILRLYNYCDKAPRAR